MFVDVTVDERTLREVYLRQFEHIVRTAKPATVMAAYNSVNGQYCCENKKLLTDILRQDWGYRGIVISDWVLAVHSTAPSLLAGLDIEMPTDVYFSEQALADALTAGAIAQGDVDAAVRRVLRTKLKYLTAPVQVPPTEVETPAHVALTLQAAQESIVLLKNDGQILPLTAAALKKLVVLGPYADVVNLGDVGSSNSVPAHAVTPLAGLKERLGPSVAVTLGSALTLTSADKAALAAADAAILVVGLNFADEGEAILPSGGDREHLLLDPAQVALIHAVRQLNPKTIVVVEGGSAVVVDPWQDDAAALLYAWYPGQEGGKAIADVILGNVNPSGHLPITLVQSEAQLPTFVNTVDAVTYDYWHGYRWLDRQNLTASYPFGFGLGYSQFELVAGATVEQVGQEVRLHASVRNTSSRSGLAVVQGYVSYPSGPVERPVRDLQAIAKLLVAPGAVVPVDLVIPVDALKFWDVASHSWKLSAGTYQFQLGFSSRDLPVTLGLGL